MTREPLITLDMTDAAGAQLMHALINETTTQAILDFLYTTHGITPPGILPPLKKRRSDKAGKA